MENTANASDVGKLECELCKQMYHRVDLHLKRDHPEMTLEEYQDAFPGASLMSSVAMEAERKRSREHKREMEILAPEPAPDLFRVGVATLPVYNPEDFDPEDRCWIPDHDENWTVGDRERDQWEALALEIELGGNALIVGPTGCGKSASVLELASIVGRPVRRMNLHGDVRAAHFIGEKLVTTDHETMQSVTSWRDGIFTQAWKSGHWILLEEIDFGPPPILAVIQAALENGGRLVLSENGGEVINKHPNTRVIATANTLGRGDETGLYAGTNVLNEAFLDRFATVIEANYPDAETERAIVVAKSGVDSEAAKLMVAVAQKVREAYAKETAFCTLSTRRLIEWGRKTARFKNWEKAAQLTVLNKLTTDDRKFVESTVQRIFGDLKAKKTTI